MASKTMKAAQYHPDSNECRVNEIPIPDITDDEILVKIASASLCHSDLMLFNGSLPASGDKPITMGHEGVGYVERCGANVKGYKKGDRLGFLYIKGCCSFHGVDSCGLKPGQWMAIVGCGGLGQMAIQFAKAMGFNVVGLDINDAVLKAAKDVGADIVLNSTKPDFVDELKKATNGGADAAVVFSAAQAAYDSAAKILQIGGILMVIGLPAKPIQFGAIDLMRKLYQIRSESTGPPQQMPRAIEFIAKHNIKPTVARYKLDQIHEMIEKMQTGKTTGRMAVVF
ncbi:putative secondary metabolism biosynthetic enzyme [Cryomyces antarcticus]|uniref:Secondary metabolism biosynthetic enzyme n=1 Tax=Cryomyces antarcticus TaxID=329879 RepID=A0ABR0KUH1_9PEZI|nr:hypothetical protein LTR39_000640 [Cryomyces antarcticus]KAK5020520.1 hypothetical protein LTR60_000442 [Cryomyces antarcticus]KAK5131515.1 putative secondary metabolism biosynthetic enzyme [Cryomyces antarcticus]